MTAPFLEYMGFLFVVLIVLGVVLVVAAAIAIIAATADIWLPISRNKWDE